MELSVKLNEGVASWETVIFLYTSALKEVGTKLEILNDEFCHIHRYNPIEYIKSRIRRRKALSRSLSATAMRVPLTIW